MRNYHFPIVITLFFFIACQHTPSDSIFRMNLNSNLNTLDPAFAKDQNSTWVTSQIFNGLIELDTALQPRPAIAKSWSISNNGLVYQFVLRNDVYFHESPLFKNKIRRVNSYDVKYSFTRICNPKTASPGFWIFNGKIQGLSEYLEGKKNEIEGFKIINDTIFEIQLTQPFSPFLYLLATPYTFIVPHEIIQNSLNFSQNPIGTGPFIFKYWEKGKSLILHKNPHYFEKNLPHLEAIEVRILPSKLTAFAEFKKGNLDFINHLDPIFLHEILDSTQHLKPEYAQYCQLSIAPQLSTEYLAFRLDKNDNPLRNREIRKALNYLIDRKALVKYLLKGVGVPAEKGFLPIGMPGFSNEIQGYDYNPAQALELLKKTGYQNFKDVPEFVLFTNPNYQKLAMFIQHSFEKHGLKCKIELLEPSTLRKEITEGKIDFWRASWMADYPDPENYFSLFYSPYFSPNGPNTTHFFSSSVDSLYQLLNQTYDVQKRKKIIVELENRILEEAPMIYLYYEQTTRLVRKEIQHFYVDPMNNLRLKHVVKK